MLEQIVARMIFDRTCNVCQGIKRYVDNASATFKTIECKACNGKGYVSSVDETSVLLVPNKKRMVNAGILASMGTQNMFCYDGMSIEVARGIQIRRLYTYNVDPDSVLFKMAKAKLTKEASEIHMYFD